MKRFAGIRGNSARAGVDRLQHHTASPNSRTPPLFRPR